MQAQGKRMRIMTHLRDFKFQISHHYHPTEVHCRLLTQGKVLICPYASWHSCKIRFRTRSLPRQSLLGSGLRDSPCALIGGALCHPALRAPLARLRGSGSLFVGEQGASPLPTAMPPGERAQHERARRARVGNSPRREPRQDKSPASCGAV